MQQAEQTAGFPWLDIPWSAVLVLLAGLFGFLTWVVRKWLSERYVTNDSLETLRQEMLEEFRGLHRRLEQEYATTKDLNGLGERVQYTDKQIDGLVTLFDRTAARADMAIETAQGVSRDLTAFAALVDERLKPLGNIGSKMEALSEAQNRMLGFLQAKLGVED